MIDWQRVGELRDEIGAEDFADIVDIFLDEVDQTIETLRSAGPEQHEGLFHFLKGSSMNLGFAEFAGLCQAAEAAARAGDGATPDVGRIINSYENSKAHFLGQLPMQFAA